ncbi:MAG: hypothetical protein ACR2IH_00735 [Pyrinomonadaceae bacterium]
MSILLISAASFASLSCESETKPASPLETFQTYTKAMKQKDTTTMKLLLSSESIKMHEQEAKARGLTLDDVVKSQTLVGEDQKTVEFRNEKIDGDKSTLEVKTQGAWVTVPFIREDSVWKIDEKAYTDNMMQDMEQSDHKIDELINRGRQQP